MSEQNADYGARFFRCAVHNVVLPGDQYLAHCDEAHGGNLITVTPLSDEDAAQNDGSGAADSTPKETTAEGV